MSGDPDAGNLGAEAVRVLTAAAHRLRADGTPCDFADFLAGVLGATAANLGGIEQLLAGRPGSWEAAEEAGAGLGCPEARSGRRAGGGGRDGSSGG